MNPAARPNAALLIVDMQNEFLTSEGMLREPVDGVALVGPLTAVIAAARARGHVIVWIRSAYPTREQRPPARRPTRPEGDRYAGVPMNDDLLASGHAGRPCCAPGSAGAELYPPIAAQVQEHDLTIQKTYYSAFVDRELDAALRERGVGRVLVCGVLADVCVRATACDAFFLGYDVTAISDCIGATTRRRAREGLDAIARHYWRVDTSAQLLTRWGGARWGLGAGDSGVLYGVLPPELSARAFAALKDEIDWQEMRHRGGPVPRRISIQGTIEGGVEPVYRHPADEQPALVPWTPTAEQLRALTSARLSQAFNHALIQHYPDGESYISPHADKTLDIERGTRIVNLSLGATRTMILRSKDKLLRGPDGAPQADIQRVHMPHGSIFVLGWETNRHYMHGIRQDRRREGDKRDDERRASGERISLTFRTIATFQLPSGRLYGQGARIKTRAEALAAAAPTWPNTQVKHDEALAMLSAFSQENRDSEFDWDAHYGRGFDVLNFTPLKRPPPGDPTS